jgi:hypothetical protein
MSFWNLPTLEPTRKFRFQISAPGGGPETGVWIHAKSIDKPTYDINVGEYQIGNQKLKYPGIVTWSDINITVVDTGDKTKDLYKNLSRMGWNVPGANFGLEKQEKSGTTPCRIKISQLNAKGVEVEEWHLENAFFKSVNFGSLAYSDDELVEIQITVTFDYATFRTPQEARFRFGQGGGFDGNDT